MGFNIRFSLCLILSLLMGLAACSGARKILKPPSEGRSDIFLSQVLKEELTGIQFEQEKLAVYTQQVQSFLRFRQGKMTPVEKLIWTADCLAKPIENIFCEFLNRKNNVTVKPPSLIKSKTIKSKKVLNQIAKVFKKKKNLTLKDLDFLNPYSETVFHRAFKKNSTWDEIDAMAQFVLKSEQCLSLDMLVALAQKAEEFFPNDLYREQAVSFYTKAVRCHPSQVETSKAYFRLGLLHIWQNECVLAQPLLQQLSQLKLGEYAARSLYWQAFCANAIGKKEESALYVKKLFEEYPLSFHTLVSSRGERGILERLMRGEDSVIRFRSQARLELNDFVRAVEILQSLNKNKLALELLGLLEKRMERSEASFCQYLAILYRRSGDILGSFRVLSYVFQTDPAQLSKLSLDLFYPLWRFELVQESSEIKQIDPYLISALIRQESGFNTQARSPAGALGLMQILPKTARRIERVSRKSLFDAKINIRLGVKYFNQLFMRYEGDAELSLAAYNAGALRVDEWLKRYPTKSRMLFLDLIPYRETRDYVALITRNYYWYLLLNAEEWKRAHLFHSMQTPERM